MYQSPPPRASPKRSPILSIVVWGLIICVAATLFYQYFDGRNNPSPAVGPRPFLPSEMPLIRPSNP